MARTFVAQSTGKPERPLAGRIFGLFTPILNRLVTRIAGKRHVPLYVLLRHRGRRSGREYATPVVGLRVPGGFAIPMAFGEGADWYRNIIASGGGTVRQARPAVRCRTAGGPARAAGTGSTSSSTTSRLRSRDFARRASDSAARSSPDPAGSRSSWTILLEIRSSSFSRRGADSQLLHIAAWAASRARRGRPWYP